MGGITLRREEAGLNADEMQHEVENSKYTANVEQFAGHIRLA
jgi:hypothetical protein